MLVGTVKTGNLFDIVPLPDDIFVGEVLFVQNIACQAEDFNGLLLDIKIQYVAVKTTGKKLTAVCILQRDIWKTFVGMISDVVIFIRPVAVYLQSEGTVQRRL